MHCGQKVIFKHGFFGVWEVAYFSAGNIVWIKPTENSHPGLATLADHGTIGVSSNELQPYRLTGEPIHGIHPR